MRIHLIIEQYDDYKRLIESSKKRIIAFAEDNNIIMLQKEVSDLKIKEKQLDDFMFLDTSNIIEKDGKIK